MIVVVDFLLFIITFSESFSFPGSEDGTFLYSTLLNIFDDVSWFCSPPTTVKKSLQLQQQQLPIDDDVVISMHLI